MWGSVILLLLSATSLFSAAAFGQPKVLYELIFGKKPAPIDLVVQPGAPPAFVPRYIYPTGSVERVEFTLQPDSLPSASADDFFRLNGLSFGTVNGTGQVFQVECTIKNVSKDPIQLELDKRFFALEDDRGNAATLIYFCCPCKGEILSPGQERNMQLFFAGSGWSGKGINARFIYVKAKGLLPIVSATWKAHTLAMAN